MNKTHDNLENKVYQIIKNDYIWVAKNVEYRKNNTVIGEIDLLAYVNGYYDHFEIKSSDTEKARKHAFEQLKRIKNHLNLPHHYFYYIADTPSNIYRVRFENNGRFDKIKYEWIRENYG